MYFSAFSQSLKLTSQEATQMKEVDVRHPQQPPMHLQNAPSSGLSELFPKEALEMAVERSSCVLHDKVIRKAMSLEKPPKKSAKRFQFSQSARQSQPTKRSGPQSSQPTSGKGTPFSSSSGVKTPSSSIRHGRGRSLQSSLSPFQLHVESILGQH